MLNVNTSRKQYCKINMGVSANLYILFSSCIFNFANTNQAIHSNLFRIVFYKGRHLIYEHLFWFYF